MPRKTKAEIAKENAVEKEKYCWKPHHRHCHSGGAIYGLGFIGAAIYYVSKSHGFWMGVWGIIKAIVWPAILVYGGLKYWGL